MLGCMLWVYIACYAVAGIRLSFGETRPTWFGRVARVVLCGFLVYAAYSAIHALGVL